MGLNKPLWLSKLLELKLIDDTKKKKQLPTCTGTTFRSRNRARNPYPGISSAGPAPEK